MAYLLFSVLGTSLPVYAEDTPPDSFLEEDGEFVEDDFTDILEEKFDEELYGDMETEEEIIVEEDPEEEVSEENPYSSEEYLRYYPVSYSDDWLSYMQDNYPATRCQYPFGTCYAHAAMASAELWALKNGIADISVDYSEAHLGYWMCHILPIGPEEGRDQLVDGYKDMTTGGYFPNIANTLSHGSGPVLEGVVPYARYDELASGEELDDATALQHEIRLVSSRTLTDMDDIKQCIVENGSVNVSMNYDAWYESASHKDAYYYVDDKDYESTNHMLVIVGWDDAYPKENFQPKYNKFEGKWMGGTPSFDGAWLARNSSSTEVLADASSYFWISYESSQLYFRSMEFSDDLTYDHEYTYNQVCDIMGGSPKGKVFANQYIAESDCNLGAVSFLQGPYTKGSEYDLDVFVSEDEISVEDPEHLLYHTTGNTSDEFGYYRIDIDPIHLYYGEYFLIRITFPEDRAHIVAESASTGSNGTKVLPNSLPGRSFLQWDGKWIDVGKTRNYDLLISAFTDEPVFKEEHGDGVIVPKDFETIPEEDPVKYTGLCQQDNKWVYLTDGELDTEKYGFVEYNGGRFLVAHGTIAKVDGLAMDPDSGDWYFCSGGQICDYSGLAMYDNEWFYVQNGKLNTEFSGLVPYNSGWFYVAAGRIVREANGLVIDPNTGIWYFCSFGQIQTQYSGEVVYNGETCLVENGRLI